MSKKISNQVKSMRILKIATCLNNSGKATLTYHIGSTSDNDIQFRLIANTGGGLFSSEWISLPAIQIAFEKAAVPLASFPLIQLYKGKSTNTPAFLMAVLKHEGLVRNLEGNVRGYETVESYTFMDEMHALIATGIDLKHISPTPIKKSATTVPSKKSKQAYMLITVRCS